MTRRPAAGGPGPANAERARRCRERLADRQEWRAFLGSATEDHPRGWIPGDEDEDGYTEDKPA